MSHHERAHSKFSASGAERWINCPGSVALSEGLPDHSTPAAEEGTRAHEVLEAVLVAETSGDASATWKADRLKRESPPEMRQHAMNAANFVMGVQGEHEYSELHVETRVYLDFIHPEMFGTFDSAVVEHFGRLNVFDFKYGKHSVSPVKNLQMLFYGVGMAHRYDWNFETVRLWIIQPRARAYSGPLFWDLPILKLKKMVEVFERGVERIESEPTTYVEGEWCYFCKANKAGLCPLKNDKRLEKGFALLDASPLR